MAYSRAAIWGELLADDLGVEWERKFFNLCDAMRDSDGVQ